MGQSSWGALGSTGATPVDGGSVSRRRTGAACPNTSQNPTPLPNSMAIAKSAWDSGDDALVGADRFRHAGGLRVGLFDHLLLIGRIEGGLGRCDLGIEFSSLYCRHAVPSRQ